MAVAEAGVAAARCPSALGNAVEDADSRMRDARWAREEDQTKGNECVPTNALVSYV